MLAVALLQVTPLEVCLATNEIVIGQHSGGEHDDCGHDEDSHSDGCSGEERPCEDEHVEIALEVGDYSRVTLETKLFGPATQHLAVSSLETQLFSRPPPKVAPAYPLKQPPDIPVFLSLGVMRL